jgi:hypothetical protein
VARPGKAPRAAFFTVLRKPPDGCCQGFNIPCGDLQPNIRSVRNLREERAGKHDDSFILAAS